MKLNIKVISKGSNTKPMGHVCPWVLDVPPETANR